MDFDRARRAMVDNQLRTHAVTDRRILVAMGDVPREQFVPEARRALAYSDDTHLLPGAAGRALAAPAPFARLLQLAQIGPDDAVLDVGTGTGYSAAVIARLAGHVTALESDEELLALAHANLAAAGAANVTLMRGPLLGGAPRQGPYDVIVLEGAVHEVPDALLRQLKQGGRLVAIVRSGATSAAVVYVRSGDEFAPRFEFNTTLPALMHEARPEVFVF